MSYTEHDETMDSRSLDGITASGAAESSPVGVSQEAPGVERADPAGDRTEGIAQKGGGFPGRYIRRRGRWGGRPGV